MVRKEAKPPTGQSGVPTWKPPPAMRSIKATLESAAKFNHRVSSVFSRELHTNRAASQTPQFAVDHLVVGGGELADLVHDTSSNSDPS